MPVPGRFRTLIAASWILLALSSPAWAGVFVVTTTADGNNGACTGSLCTLRDAVIAANASPGSSITLPSNAQPYKLTLTGVNEQAAATGDLDVTANLTIDGGGSATTIIDGNATDRVFEVIGAVTLTLNGVTVRNGSTASGGPKLGAGIYAPSGTVVLNNSVVTANTVGGSGNAGGGIFTATLTMTNSTVSNNTATAGGGGIVANTATITGSTISGNQALDQGGGIFAGTLTMTNSTVTGNQSTDQGGGIFAGLITISGSQITNNSGGDEGGGIFFGGNNSSIATSNISGNSCPTGAGIFLLGSGNANSPFTITITDSTFNGNTARDVGGGMALLGAATVTITGSTISGNTVTNTFNNGGGGGIDNSSVTLILINDTITGNQVQGTNGFGGGIRNRGALPITITSVTISQNSSPPPPPGSGFGVEGFPLDDSGGNVDNAGTSTLTLKNTIVANPVSGNNCLGPITNGGGNLQFPGTTCGAFTSADPLLKPLADNGGPTKTQALSFGSQAIDNAVGCPPPSSDQRGITRPQGVACEIGAFECQSTECVQGIATNTPTSTPTRTATPTSTSTATPVPRVTGVVVPMLSPPMFGLLVLALAAAAAFLLRRTGA